MANQRGRLVPGAAAARGYRWLAIGVALALGCASTSKEVDLPPQTLTDAPTSTTQEEAALLPPPSAPTAEAAPGATVVAPKPSGRDAAIDPATGRRRQTIVIETVSAAEVTPQTLQQATSSERERRAVAVEPVAVITNKNLAEQAEGGQITVLGEQRQADSATKATAAGAGAAGAATVPGAAVPADGTAAPASSEDYWRGQALKLRLDWKAAVQDVDDLQSEVQELRRRFYEEDDPFYRDNQIKPSWDRKLDLLAAAKTHAEDQERRLTRFLEDGRRAGALPGWLREGVEFEPPPTPDHTPPGQRRSDDPWEPKILQEDAQDP